MGAWLYVHPNRNVICRSIPARDAREIGRKPMSHHHHHHPDHAASINEFMASGQGASALGALQSQGLDPSMAQQVLQHAAVAAHGHVEQVSQSAGILGNHPGKSFFAAFAAGLIKGDGIWGSLKDGGEGVLTGRIAEFVADKAGVDSGTASALAAAATPYLVDYFKGKLAS
jgi:hypothetical protein